LMTMPAALGCVISTARDGMRRVDEEQVGGSATFGNASARPGTAAAKPLQLLDEVDTGDCHDPVRPLPEPVFAQCTNMR
jgi:hypothetical protein